MTPQLADTIAFAACLAGAAAPLLLLIRRKAKPNFERLVQPFNQAEEDARRRGDTRAIGKARRERKEAVHKALERVA